MRSGNMTWSVATRHAWLKCVTHGQNASCTVVTSQVKAKYTATKVACGWTGVVIKILTETFGHEP